MKEMKKIALVAHDERKKDLLEWVKYDARALTGHRIYATGTK
jgi:methylglyoxal synthase